MVTTFFQLFQQVSTELNDPALVTFDDDFPRTLCEICLNLLMLRLKPTTRSVTLAFPFDFLSIVDYLPLVDIYKLNPQPDVLVPLTVRDQNQLELIRGGFNVLNYFDDAWIRTTTRQPGESYFIATNLMGVRQVPEETTELTLTYVPYLEVFNLNDNFPLTLEFEDVFLSLLRSFLALRLSQFELAKTEAGRSLDRY